MASDDEDELIALRQAALATMGLKKKSAPAVAEDAQPIPQLTSSGHSINNANSAWAEEFPYDDDVHFQVDEPVVPFPPTSAPPPQFGQRSPAQLDRNWRGQGPRGNFNNNRFLLGRSGPFLPNQRVPFRHNHPPPFLHRMPFPRNQRPIFHANQRLPFNPRNPPPFGQNPMQYIAPPRGVGPAVGGAISGGGGNLIVINTVPEQGEVPKGPQLAAQRPPIPGGFQGARGGRGRGGSGRGRGHVDGGKANNLPVAESSSTSMLLRPQDKYCPPADKNDSNQDPAEEKVHRKKKDKFSRYNSSGSESEDESEEEEEADVSRQISIPDKDEEKTTLDSDNDTRQDEAVEDQPAEAELSIDAASTSQIDFEKELNEPELDEPLLESIDDVGNRPEPELKEEEEEQLLASPNRKEVTQSKPDTAFQCEQEARQERMEDDEDDTPIRDESPMRQPSSERDSTPVRDESPGKEDTPVRDESPGRDVSPALCSPQSQTEAEKENAESGQESDSDSESESGNNSDSSSSDNSSSASSSSDKEDGSQSGSNSNSEVDDGNSGRAVTAVSHRDARSHSHVSSHSSSEPFPSVKKSKMSSSPKSKKSPSPKKKQETSLTPQEMAKMEARRRKFESSREVTLSGNSRTISLKGIVSQKKKQRTEKSQMSDARKTESSTRVVQRKRTVAKSPSPDSRPKHSRRRVSVENCVRKRPESRSETENKQDSEEEEDDEENGSRSWMRESSRNVTHRRTLVDKPLPGSGSHRGYYQGRNRNGRYVAPSFESQRDNRPEVHYSSSDDEDRDSDRKLVSVVVQRSSAGTHQRSNKPKGEHDSARAVVSNNRKRTSDSFDDRHGQTVSKSKRFQDYNSGNDGPRMINVVIARDSSPSKQSQPGGSRVPVHQRLGKGSRHQESSRSRSSVRPVARNHSHQSDVRGEMNSDSDLDERIHRIHEKNKAIMLRQKEVMKDRELYG